MDGKVGSVKRSSSADGRIRRGVAIDRPVHSLQRQKDFEYRPKRQTLMGSGRICVRAKSCASICRQYPVSSALRRHPANEVAFATHRTILRAELGSDLPRTRRVQAQQLPLRRADSQGQGSYPSTSRHRGQANGKGRRLAVENEETVRFPTYRNWAFVVLCGARRWRGCDRSLAFGNTVLPC